MAIGLGLEDLPSDETIIDLDAFHKTCPTMRIKINNQMKNYNELIDILVNSDDDMR